MSLELHGAQNLFNMLQALGDDAMAVKAIRGASMESAKVMEAEMVAQAPVDEGRLVTFIGRASTRRDGDVHVIVGILRMSKLKFSRTGLKSGAYYARYTNDGTKFQGAQHWFDRAAAATAQPYLDHFTNACMKRVKKTAEKFSKQQR